MFPKGIFCYLLLKRSAKISLVEYPMPVKVTTLFSIFAILKKKEAEWQNYWL